MGWFRVSHKTLWVGLGFHTKHYELVWGFTQNIVGWFRVSQKNIVGWLRVSHKTLDWVRVKVICVNDHFHQ